MTTKTLPRGLAILGAALLCAATTSALAATVTVTNTADSGNGSLRAALASASNGDTINATGVAGVILLTSGQLFVSNSVTILGPGPGILAVKGDYPTTTNRVFHINPSLVVTIAGLTITNGYATGSIPDDEGAGIYNDHSSLTLSNCAISGNSADYGGGIFNAHSSLTLSSCAVSGNSADFGGAIYNDHASLTLSNCAFSGNSANYGGGIYNDGGHFGSATLSVIASTLSNNSGTNLGGGIYNFGGIGGNATLTLSNSILSSNFGGGGGGGIINDSSSAMLVNCTFSGNVSQFGGAIQNYASGAGTATLTLLSSTISSNSASGAMGSSGGGIANENATLTVLNSTLNGNSADFSGAIDNSGLSGTGTVMVLNSTLSGNSANNGGGAIFNYSDAAGLGTLTLLNSTLSGNSTNGAGGVSSGGGGIHNGSSSTDNTTVRIGSTILNAGAGANLLNDSGANNKIISLGHNLSSDNGGGFLTATADQINTDPMLGPLQNNGGPTFAHALVGISPAIDAGTNFSGLATDQRGTGFDRTVDIPSVSNAPGGDGSDIGAFEVQAAEYSVPPGFSSTNSTTFVIGASNTFTVLATGRPAPTVQKTGALPAGVSLSSGGVLSGAPPAGSSGVYLLTLLASNGVPPVATQYFTLTVVEPPTVARPSFNTNGLGWALNGDTVNGGPNITNNVFTLTDGASGENRSAWFRYPLYVGAFQASFMYQDIGGNGADGAAFVIQNDPRATAALGLAGGGLAYSDITPSVGVLLNIYSGAPGGPSGLMLGTNGVGALDGSGNPSGRSYRSTAPVNLDVGNPVAVNLRYTGGILQVSLSDTVTSANFQTNIPVNIPMFVGTNAAWVGITGSEGGVLSHQIVSNFSYVPLPVLLSNPGSGSTVTLSWPASIYGYHLQSSSNLLGNAWADLPATVTQTNGFNLATVPATGNSQFFRLVLPPQ